MANAWSLRSWMLVALLVVPYVALKEWFGFDYPLWVRGTCVAIAGLAGTAILINPELAAMKSSTLARVLGALIVTAASFGAYQLMQISPE